MAEEVLIRALEGIQGRRRTSLPIFPSDLGKDVPNYLRVSTGSCHDYCKYGKKEMPQVQQKRPWIKRIVVVPLVSRNAVLSKVDSVEKKTWVARLKALDKPPSTCEPEILPNDKTSEASFKQSASNEKEAKASQDFSNSLKSKLLKEKPVTRKSAVTLGSSKMEIVPAPSGSWEGGRNNPDLQGLGSGKGNGNKRYVKTVEKCNKGRKHDMVTGSAKAPSTPAAMKKLNARAKAPSSLMHLKLAARATPRSSSSPHCLKPMEKARPYSSLTHLKTVSVRANYSSSLNTLKLKPATVNISPPSVYRKKTIKEGEASELRASEETVATRLGSVSPKVKVATNLKKKEVQLGEAEIAETKEFYLKNDGDLSHLTELEFGNQEVMESHDEEIPEKTLYVIKMETGNAIQTAPNAEDKIPDLQLLASLTPPLSPKSQFCVPVSNMTAQHEASQLELTTPGMALPCAEQETPDIQPLPSCSPSISPKSQSSIMPSNRSSHYELTQDDSWCTESEEGYSSYEDDHRIKGKNLKSADNTEVKKSATVTSQDNGKDPVKLNFRRGTVIDVTQKSHGPRRLKFRKVKDLEEKVTKDFNSKSSFKVTETTQDNATTDNNSEMVVLRHQDMQDKKDTRGLFNNVIEETASKLVETRKSKVKALVGAFETVICLQDGKPATT